MKIAVVLMPWCRRESPSPEFALAAALLKKENHKVSIYDINNSIFNDKFSLRKYWHYLSLDASPEIEKEFFDLTREIYDYYASQILSQENQAIVFKIVGQSYFNSLEMASVIKKKDKDKTVIFCGMYVKKEDVEAVVKGQDGLPYDYVICGEDEVALPELIKRLEMGYSPPPYQKGKVIDCTDGPIIEDLDALPYYDFSDFNLPSYRFPDKLEILISKGCPWRCSFCADWLTENRYRSMSGERIYREVQHQIKIHKTKHFRFHDKTINGNIKAISDFCDLMLEGHKNGSPPIKWSGDAMIRPEMTKDLLVKMHRVGCSGLGYGLESGSERVLGSMNKRFSIAIAEEVIKNTHDAGIFTSVNIMIGFPAETYSDFQETLDLIERNKGFIGEIRLTYLGCRILKDTILYKYPERFNIDNTDLRFWSTRDGLNTYDERARRYRVFCQRALDLGIILRINGRITKKVLEID